MNKKKDLDLLDENGNKIGKTKLRSEVHKDGDWHKGVHIWIINEEGEILLQRRSQDKDSNSDMLDVSCAGHLSSGDDSLDTAIRELKEELGIEITKKDLCFIKTLKTSTKYTDTFINNEFDDLYILKTDKKIKNMKIQKEEVSELYYVPYDEVKEMVRNNDSNLVMRSKKFEVLFSVLDSKIK